MSDIQNTQQVKSEQSISEKINSIVGQLYNEIKKIDILKIRMKLGGSELQSVYNISSIDEYASSHNQKQMQDAAYSIEQDYSLWLGIRGDGNCFYRSVMIAYLMQLTQNESCEDLEKFILSIIELNDIQSDNQALIGLTCDKLKCIFLIFLLKIRDLKRKNKLQEMTDLINEYNALPELDLASIVICRYMIYSTFQQHKKNPQLKFFIEEEMEKKIPQILLKYYEYAEDIIIPLAAQVISINILNYITFEVELVVQNLYREYADGPINIEKLSYFPFNKKDDKIYPQIHVLFTQCHYESLISNQLMIQQPIYYQHQFFHKFQAIEFFTYYENFMRDLYYSNNKTTNLNRSYTNNEINTSQSNHNRSISSSNNNNSFSYQNRENQDSYQKRKQSNENYLYETPIKDNQSESTQPGSSSMIKNNSQNYKYQYSTPIKTNQTNTSSSYLNESKNNEYYQKSDQNNQITEENSKQEFDSQINPYQQVSMDQKQQISSIKKSSVLQEQNNNQMANQQNQKQQQQECDNMQYNQSSNISKKSLIKSQMKESLSYKDYPEINSFENQNNLSQQEQQISIQEQNENNDSQNNNSQIRKSDCQPNRIDSNNLNSQQKTSKQFANNQPEKLQNQQDNNEQDKQFNNQQSNSQQITQKNDQQQEKQYFAESNINTMNNSNGDSKNQQISQNNNQNEQNFNLCVYCQCELNGISKYLIIGVRCPHEFLCEYCFEDIVNNFTEDQEFIEIYGNNYEFSERMKRRIKEKQQQNQQPQTSSHIQQQEKDYNRINQENIKIEIQKNNYVQENQDREQQNNTKQNQQIINQEQNEISKSQDLPLNNNDDYDGKKTEQKNVNMHPQQIQISEQTFNEPYMKNSKLKQNQEIKQDTELNQNKSPKLNNDDSNRNSQPSYSKCHNENCIRRFAQNKVILESNNSQETEIQHYCNDCLVDKFLLDFQEDEEILENNGKIYHLSQSAYSVLQEEKRQQQMFLQSNESKEKNKVICRKCKSEFVQGFQQQSFCKSCVVSTTSTSSYRSKYEQSQNLNNTYSYKSTFTDTTQQNLKHQKSSITGNTPQNIKASYTSNSPSTMIRDTSFNQTRQSQTNQTFEPVRQSSLYEPSHYSQGQQQNKYSIDREKFTNQNVGSNFTSTYKGKYESAYDNKNYLTPQKTSNLYSQSRTSESISSSTPYSLAYSAQQKNTPQYTCSKCKVMKPYQMSNGLCASCEVENKFQNSKFKIQNTISQTRQPKVYTSSITQKNQEYTRYNDMMKDKYPLYSTSTYKQ